MKKLVMFNLLIFNSYRDILEKIFIKPKTCLPYLHVDIKKNSL